MVSVAVPLIEMRGVTFGYAQQPLLYDVHLQVSTGENVALLQEALAAAQRGLPVLLFVPDAENSVMKARDYTGGKGLRLMRELLQAGAVVVGSLPEAIEITRRYTQHEAHT